MKRLSPFLFLLLPLNIFAQTPTCDCQADLNYLNRLLRKSAPYKENKKGYEEAFLATSSKVTTGMSYYACYLALSELLISLNDWHASILEQVDDGSPSLVIYPEYAGNIQVLAIELEQKPKDQIEGIYTNARLSMGIHFNEASGRYEGIVLSSSDENWKAGDIIIEYKKLNNGYYKAMGSQFPTKRLISYYDRFNEGVLLRAGFRKDTTQKLYYKSPSPDELFQLKALNEQTQYLKVGTFTGQYPVLKEAETFYKTLEGNLTAEQLILDLRDNGGGGDRNSDLLLKQLKSYLKKGRLHIITNASTGSNAEQFTVKLKDQGQVTTYGDKTRGALAYEITPKDYHTLPSSGFLVILTGKRHKKFLPYETKGVEPVNYLSYTNPWIDQVLDIINQE
jgi:hypothetical protein